MGRKTDVLLRGFRAAKCLTLLKLATARIKVLRNKRSISARQMRGEIAQLLKSGQDSHVYITKVDALIKQENMVAFYDIIDQYCHAIISRFPMIEMQSNCPIDMKEPIASLIFAAPRCVELSELASIKEAFIAKYGKEFAAAAAELRPDCGVNKQVIELLSTRPATGDMKLKIMKEICVENNVKWTPGEALAEPTTNMPAGSSQQPVKTKMEAVKVTGDAGSSKATLAQAAPLRVNEAGPSNLSAGTKSALQGGSKPEGINKSGLSAALKHGFLATVASKSSGTKHGLSPEEGAEKANASVSQSVKGAANTGIPSVKSGLSAAESLKTGDGAVFAANAFKTNDTKEEGMGAASLTGLQSLKGVINTGTSSGVSGSFKESKGEPVAKAEGYVQPVVDAQDGLSDSDNDSFVSVEEERFDDDVEVSSMGGEVRRESFGTKSLKASVAADANGPSLIKKPSRETRESSSSTERPHEDVYCKASSKKSSFTLESSQAGTFLKESSKNSLNTDVLQEEKPFRAESRESSLKEEKSSGLMMESFNADALQEENPFILESRKSSLREEKSSGLIMESLNTDALLEEKAFRVESRKSSLREDKSSGLILESAHEDMYLRASSKNSLNTDISLEEKAFRAESRKSSSTEKKLVEEQSFIQVEDNNLMKQQLEEEQLFEANVEEGMQDASLGVTTESSVPQTLGEEYPFEEQQNRMTTGDGLQEKGIIEDTSNTESSLVENLVEMKKIMSLSVGISAEEMPSEAAEEVAGKEASSNIEKSPESVSKQIDDVLLIRKEVQEVVGSASLGALATPDDFAAAAKAIAAEAARLAVLDYAKRIAGSSAIPVDLADLTNFGLDFKGGSQVTKKLHSEGKSELVDSQEVQDGGDITNDVIKEEASKVEIAMNDDESINSDRAKVGGMGYADMEKSLHSKTPIADDGANGNNASSNTLGHPGTLTKEDSLQQPVMDSGNDEINPFAREGDKAKDSLFSETGEDESSSWVNKTKPEMMSKAGGFVQEEDHLDIFFRRKTPRFDEDGYSFVKMNPSLTEEKVPYFGYDKKERISQDKFFVSTPVFDSFPERQSVLVEESSGSFKSPVFDDGEPEKYDASFCFDDGMDKSNPAAGLSDENRPQSPSNVKASACFDPEPEPSFDNAAEEEEQSIIQKSESTQLGQLKWQSKKPTKASEGGETLASDASLGEESKPLSRRTRKQPQRVDGYAHGSDIPAQAELFADGGLTSRRPQGSSSSLMQQQRKEQGRYDVAEKGNLRTKPTESFAYSSDAMGKRPSRSPNRVSYDFSKESQSDGWDSTSAEDSFPTIKTTKSPIRSSQRQKIPLEENDEDFYFSEEIPSSSARSSMSGKTTKSPTSVAMQPQGYDDDAEAYKFINKPSRTPNFSQQNLADDDSFEESPVARYKPFRQSDDLGMETSANLAMSRQKPHRQQEDYKSESVHMQYVQVSGVGKSKPTNRLPARQKQQDVEEEDDLASGYPSVHVDDRGKSYSSRPLSSRTKIEEEEPNLASRYKPSAQVDDRGRASSSPMSGRRQRYQLPQEEEQEVSMEQDEQEEFYSMPLPDWRQQGDRHKEQQRMPRPRYGQKQDLILEKENSDSSTEDYEQEQAEQRRLLILSEQEKQRRRLPAYGQEKQHRPLPLSQEYEEEERTPRPLYGRKQDLRMEKENLDLTTGEYGRPILSEQKQDGQETKRRPLPSYRQEKQRRPSPPLYDQEEEFQSMPLPDWRQEEWRREKERMSRPLYGQKQDSRLEKETSDVSAKGYEQYQEEQWCSSMLSEQDQGGQQKQRRRLPLYRQENQHRPLPPLQQYEQEEEKEEFDSMPLPDWRQEERRKEKERMSRPLYGPKQDLRPEKANVNLSIEDYEQQQEEPLMSSEQEQYGQEKQRRPSPPYGRQLDSKLGKTNFETRKQEKIRQDQQQPSSDRQQQQSLAEEVARKGQQGREKERLPSPVYMRQQEIQEEKKFSLSMEHNELCKEEQLQHSTAMPEGKQEQDGQGNGKRPWPLHNRKQESKDEPTFGQKQQSLAKEEGTKGQQEKSEIKEQLPGRKSLVKDEAVKTSQEKPEIKAQPSTGRPPSLPAQTTSPPLESSVSDPVILATIPPPVKKPSVGPAPAATTLESFISAPPPTSATEVKGPKVPQRPPNVEDLLANFEALRRARKGE